MSFQKYVSIENSYRAKYIQIWINKYPELMNIQYEITEKIHGSCLQFIFEPHKDFKVASKNKVIERNDNFFRVWEVVERRTPELKVFQEYINIANISMNVYGELFGKGVQKGVYYSDQQDFRIFNIQGMDNLVSPKTAYDFLYDMGLEYLYVPVLKIADGLEEALDFDVNRISSYTPNMENNFAEGVVIKPYKRVYFIPVDNVFMLKNKHPNFTEKQKAPKEPKEPNICDDKLISLNITFREYINENRLNGIFSKYGMIESTKQIGDYIKYMLEDAKEDFFKDNEINLDNFGKKEQKIIFNVGSTIAEMLKRHL